MKTPAVINDQPDIQTACLDMKLCTCMVAQPFLRPRLTLNQVIQSTDSNMLNRAKQRTILEFEAAMQGYDTESQIEIFNPLQSSLLHHCLEFLLTGMNPDRF